MIEIQDFKDVVKNYEVVFFDAFGVLKNSGGMIAGIEKTFEYLIANNIEFYILTNDASRGPLELAQSYIDAGLTMIDEYKIISSGMLTEEYLKNKVTHGRVAYLGPKESVHYLKGTGLKAVSIKDLELDSVEDVNALAFLDDEGFDWQDDLNKIVNLLRIRNIPVVVANTDRSYPVTDREVAIAVGSLADMIEKITGRKFIKFGKPDSSMFIFAFQHTLKAQDVGKEKILMVGDTLFTDIIGGNKFGIDTALVLTGNTLKAHYMDRIKAIGVSPDHVCHSAVVE